MKPIIYLSAPFGKREDIRAKAYTLRYLGYKVTSRWLEPEGRTLEQAANIDAVDISNSTMLVRFSDPEYFSKK
jgi:hypothetical protein